jgi:enoyl-CoA hydratase/carnithine racemase
MSKILVEHQGNIAVLTLNNGVTNAIGPDLVNELSENLHQIRNEAGGIVLCGGEKFFSIGFDLPVLLTMNRPEMSEFFYQFNQLTLDLYTVPFPSACAVSGHATAGGNILALTCDYRFAVSGTKKIGLNEIRLGLPVPHLPDMILRQIVGDRAATRMLYSGELISLTDAASIGLIDETCPAEKLRQSAIEKVAGLAAFHARPFSAIKENRVEEIKDSYEKNKRAKNEFFLDCWFSESTQKILKATSQKF